MNTKNAEVFMRCYRAGQTRRRDSLFTKATQFAEKDPALSVALKQQLEFDAYVTARIHTLQVPESVTEEVTRLAGDGRIGLTWKNPAVLSVILGLLLIAGLAVYFWIEKMDNFEGRDAAEEMVERTAGMRGTELEPLDSRAGDLEDWMFMQGIEGYPVPPDFAHFHAVGGRVFSQKGFPVVQLAVEENQMIFFLFHQPDFGISLKPDDGWMIFSREGWVAAVRGEGANGFMLAFPGVRADMKDVLRDVEAKAASVSPTAETPAASPTPAAAPEEAPAAEDATPAPSEPAVEALPPGTGDAPVEPIEEAAEPEPAATAP